MHPLVPVFVLLSASTLWGLTWLPLKHFGGFGIEGPLVTLLAHGSVGLLSLPLLATRRAEWIPHWKAMAVLAFFGGMANIAFATAMLEGDVTRVMVLFYLLPAWGVLGGRVLLGERIDWRRRLSLVLALLGAFCILGGFRIAESPPAWNDLIAVAAGFGLAMNNVLFRKAAQVPVPSKIAISFIGCLVWAALLVAFGASPVPEQVPAIIWSEVVGFGVIWILVATIGTMWGVNQMEAGRSSVLIVMELVTAVGSAAWISGAKPTALEWTGGALILISALLEGARGEPEPSASPG